MTKQQIEDTYEFKLAKKILKREYPFILDLQVDTEPTKYNAIIFVDAIIDVNKLSDMLNLPVDKNVDIMLKHFGYYTAVYLHHLLDYETQENRDKLLALESSVNKTLDALHKSKAIPEKLKLPKVLSIPSYRVIPL